MNLIIACLKLKRLFGQLEAESDEMKRRVLARLASDYCQTLHKSLSDEQMLSELAITELRHRLKNKMATVQSIISYQLRDHETTRDIILQRLSALSSADMLIETAQGHGAFIKDIINIELDPYEISRATIEGPQIFLPAKLASALALIFHELATNAIKYGALSCPSGRVSCLWSIAGSKLILEWRESGGPTVTIPTHKGFGTRLLSCALEQFSGAADTNFAATGVVCTMSLAFSPEVFVSPLAVPSQPEAPTLNTFSSDSDRPPRPPSSLAVPGDPVFKTTAL